MKTIRAALVCLMALGLSAAAWAQTASDEMPLNLDEQTVETAAAAPPDLWSSFVMMTCALSAVLALIALAGWLVKKYVPVQKIGGGGASASGNAIQILATKHIGNRQSLVLLQVRGSHILIGRGAQQLTTLARLDGDEHEELARQDIVESLAEYRPEIEREGAASFRSHLAEM